MDSKNVPRRKRTHDHTRKSRSGISLGHTYSIATSVSHKKRCYGRPFPDFQRICCREERRMVGRTGPKTRGFILGNYFKFCRRATPLDEVRDDDATTIETNNGSPLRPTFALAFFVFARAYLPPLQIYNYRSQRGGFSQVGFL